MTKVKDGGYARLRNVLLRPAVGASPDGVGALFPAAAAVAEAVVFFTAEEGAWFRAAVVLFAAVLDVVDVLVALRAPVAVLVGLTFVAPEDALEETLFRRSRWRVAGRGKGELTPLVPAPALLAGRAVCDGYLPLVDVVAPFAPELAELVVRRGLEGFRGEIGFDRYPVCCDFSGELRNGDCGYVLELRDFGDRIR